ncbi:lysosomal carboxypeptidase [Naegleria gruberi]|uniref:Lysosomal carboxypeptidase n=1 Tax=Naegleria gruberi TaxID=5762 RepID=D2V3P5_NAEGR|nr:lysosomal carboxypeptidase [Naegleria gruberi]EFC48673.1 lysosomal carboxypeptidase [Naegleria gruberi]|eukprot:XP_002681417.1 lysosomal carboxypeptidase [Naegleria gruberi strain NEG-M]
MQLSSLLVAVALMIALMICGSSADASSSERVFLLKRDPVSMLSRKQSNKSTRMASALPPYKTLYFDQKLDHFDFTNDKTFKQRYLVCDSFVGKMTPSTPIFFYTGNEGDIVTFYENTGLMFDTAPQFNALIIFVEHRYYGVSNPFGPVNSFTPENIKWLSSEQALADYSYFITEMFGLDEKRTNPVIAFGGSYGGMLSSWWRMKYPHIVDGAIAASAPIFQFTGLTAPNVYNQICTEDFKKSSNLAKYHETCDAVIKNGLSILNQYYQNNNPQILQKLSSQFRICSPGIRTSADVNQLISWLTQAYNTLPMIDYPYPANFLMPLPGYPIQVICDRISTIMASEKVTTDTYLKAVLEGANVYYNYTGTSTCNNLTQPDSPSLGDDGWEYQTCNEMVMPIGNYPQTDMFIPAPWDLQAWISYCQQKWKVTPRTNWAITNYGGKRAILEATNIVFSNGDLDPWHGGGVLPGMKVNEKVKVVYIEGGAHHLDLRSSNPLDPQSVRLARALEVKEITAWLNEFSAKRGLKMKY